MIVISGALVLVALALLIVGLVASSTGLAFVYASIAVSVVSAVFLFLGVRQRRDVLSVPSGSPVSPPVSAEPDSEVAVVRPRSEVGTAVDPVAAPTAEPTAEAVGPGAAEPVAPVAPLVAGEPEPEPEPEPEREPEPEPQPASEVQPEAKPAAPARKRAPAKKTAKKAPSTLAGPAKKAPSTLAGPAKKAAPAKKSAARETVVVVPDRDKYHRPDCRFVRDVADTEDVSKAAARRRGLSPCGVCKP